MPGKGVWGNLGCLDSLLISFFVYSFRWFRSFLTPPLGGGANTVRVAEENKKVLKYAPPSIVCNVTWRAVES